MPRWTQAEDQRLAELYGHHSAREIGELMDRSRAAIKNRVNILRIAKGENNGCFQKGFTPWNKGKSFIAGGRATETQFKPGQKPHTWHPIGHERITDEGYLQRKTSDTGVTRRDYVNVHWLVWFEAGREIPAGQVLIFKDGNRRNLALDNMELITRRDLMRRNSVHNYGPEIAALHQLQGAITRQINKRRKSA